jgi:hypothetical protein
MDPGDPIPSSQAALGLAGNDPSFPPTKSLCPSKRGSANSKNGLLGLKSLIASRGPGSEVAKIICGNFGKPLHECGQNAAASAKDRRAFAKRRGNMTHAGLAAMAVAARLGPA